MVAPNYKVSGSSSSSQKIRRRFWDGGMKELEFPSLVLGDFVTSVSSRDPVRASRISGLSWAWRLFTLCTLVGSSTYTPSLHSFCMLMTCFGACVCTSQTSAPGRPRNAAANAHASFDADELTDIAAQYPAARRSLQGWGRADFAGPIGGAAV